MSRRVSVGCVWEESCRETHCGESHVFAPIDKLHAYVCTGWEEEPYEEGGRKIFERNYAGSLAHKSSGAYHLER